MWQQWIDNPLTAVNCKAGYSSVVLSGPRFVSPIPNEVTFLAQKGIQIECPIHGQPVPQIIWLSSTSKGF